MRIGVFICQAGIAETEAVNLEAVSLYASNLPRVEVVEVLGQPAKLDPGELATRIKESQLDRLVIAGDSPGYFKPAFTRAMSLAGGDPAEVRLASFRQYGADARAWFSHALDDLKWSRHNVEGSFYREACFSRRRPEGTEGSL